MLTPLNTPIASYIRSIPDYPTPGILFRDITPLLQDRVGFAAMVDDLAALVSANRFDCVVAIEARGFMVGAALAYRLGLGLVPVRKSGKLPANTIAQAYQLEYGEDVLEMHADALKPGMSVLLVDDLIATGGTAEAAVALIRRLGAQVTQALFVIDLPALNGMNRLKALGVEGLALCQFAGH